MNEQLSGTYTAACLLEACVADYQPASWAALLWKTHLTAPGLCPPCSRSNSTIHGTSSTLHRPEQCVATDWETRSWNKKQAVGTSVISRPPAIVFQRKDIGDYQRVTYYKIFNFPPIEWPCGNRIHTAQTRLWDWEYRLSGKFKKRSVSC